MHPDPQFPVLTLSAYSEVLMPCNTNRSIRQLLTPLTPPS